MSSQDKGVDSTGCGGAGVVDTSWIDNAAAPGPSGEGSGRMTRGRGDRKRATRRRTLSPSIGKHNYMSNVDLNDPRTFPILPSSSCDRGLDSSGRDKTSTVSAGRQEAGNSVPIPAHATKVDPSTRAGRCASRSSGLGAAGRDADLPDPTVVAGLALPLGVLGTLGNNEVVASSSAAARVKAARKRQPAGAERQGTSSGASAAPSRGRSSRRATLGGADARIFFEAENLEPAGQGQAPDHAPSPTASVLPVDGEEEERRAPPPPPVPTKKSRSRSSRRRSIVMPSEARPLMDSDLDDVGGNASVPRSIADGGSDGDTAAGAATVAQAAPAGEAEARRRGSSTSTGTIGTSKVETPAVELPLSSMNATTCLSQSLAVQRGWAAGDETTRKDLFRAFYAATPGSQRARRIAARLFCLTGYPLSPVAPEDARVLCEAAGGSLDWGLGETEPRLVSRPIRRETREQKRRLVLRIKPIFDLMEKASKEERLQAEAATGVASRKASPDGFCYENRETGKPVNPDAYKGPYLKHIKAARASRLREFAASRNVAPSTTREEGSGSSPAAGKRASPSAKFVSPPSASESAAAAADEEAEEVGNREREDPVSSPLEAAAAEKPREEEKNVVGACAGEGGGGERRHSEECASDVLVAAAEVDAGAEGNALVAVSPVANTPPSGISAETDAAVPETPMPKEQGGAVEAVITSQAALEAPVASVEDTLVVGTAEKLENEERAASTESEKPVQIAAEADGAAPAVQGEEDPLLEPGGEDINVAGQALDLESLAETGRAIRMPCSRAADGASRIDSPPWSDGCSPCTAATPVLGSVRAPLEEHAAASDRGETAVTPPSAPMGLRTPGAFGPGSDGKVSGSDAQSPHFPGSPSPVVAIEPTSRLMTTSGDRSVPFGEEELGGGGRPGSLGTDRNKVPTTSGGGEAVDASRPSTRESDPSTRAPSGGDAALGAAVLEKPSGASREHSAASPPLGAEATERQEGGPSSGRTPSAGRESQRASPSRIFSLVSASRNLGSPGAAELVVSSAREEGEDDVEIAALEQRLWAAIDAAFREYHDGVSIVMSRRQGASTPSPPAPCQEGTETADRSSADAAAPRQAREARATTALPTTRSAAGCELGEEIPSDSRVASPADGAITTAAACTDGMP
ncbi:unnamed protein product, partial [Scytosiphon promiscuus]